VSPQEEEEEKLPWSVANWRKPVEMLKTILVVFCWFSDNKKMVFWAENQQKTKNKNSFQHFLCLTC